MDRQRPSPSTASPAEHRDSVDPQPLHRPFSQTWTDVGYCKWKDPNGEPLRGIPIFGSPPRTQAKIPSPWSCQCCMLRELCGSKPHRATEPALGTDYSKRDRNSLADGSGDQPAALPVSATLGLSSWKIFISGLCGTGPGDCGEVEGKGEHCSMAVCAGTLAMGELGPGIVGAQPVLENRREHWHWSQPSPGSASRTHQVPSPDNAM